MAEDTERAQLRALFADIQPVKQEEGPTPVVPIVTTPQGTRASKSLVHVVFYVFLHLSVSVLWVLK